MNVNVAVTCGQKMSPVCACFTKFSPAVPSGPNPGKDDKCCQRRADGKKCLLHARNGTKALVRRLQKDHETKWKLILAASSRSAQGKSQRVEALVEASGSTPHIMGRAPGRPVKTRGPPRGQGGAPDVEPTSHWPGLSNFEMMSRALARPTNLSDDTPQPGTAHPTSRMLDRDPTRLITCSIFHSPAWPGPSIC